VWSEATNFYSRFAGEPDHAARRLWQEQENLSTSKIVSGVERSDKPKDETDPLGRATGPF